MAAGEMYDYLAAISADYTAEVLSVIPQRTLTEKADKNQIIHEYDDGAVDVVTLSNTSIFKCTLTWKGISDADAGTIFDLYNDPAKANARARTFYYQHVDGHTYVARFEGPLVRGYGSSKNQGRRFEFDSLVLRIEGRKAD